MTQRAAARTAGTSRGVTTAARVAPPTARATPTAGSGTSARGASSGVRTTASAPRPAGRAVPARPELRLVPTGAPARPRRRMTPALGSGRTPFVLLVVALLVGTTLGLLVLNTAIAVDSLKATELRAVNAERAEQVQRLEQQVVSAGTPAQVASAAIAAGLVPAGPAAFLVVAADGSSTLRGTPQPAEPPPAPSPAPESPAASPAEPSPAAPSPAAQSPAAPSPAAAGAAGGD